jgi:hypothetical protein
MEKTTTGGKQVRNLRIEKKNGKNLIVGQIKTQDDTWSNSEWGMDGIWCMGSGGLDLKIQDIPEKSEIMSPRFAILNRNKKTELEDIY